MTQFGKSLRSLFNHDPDACHLNHGGYGATPRAITEAQAIWRDRMEANPTRFFAHDLPGALRDAARPLAAFLGTTADRIAFVENATSGMAAVARSLKLRPGDEIVVDDHVYNAVRHLLRHVCVEAGAALVEVPVAMPIHRVEDIVNAFAEAITQRTRLIVVDHIASATAVIHPVEQIINLARQNGVPVLIDGAHGPGHLDLNLDALGADIYVGNCHKWLCAAKGAAFIHVRDGSRLVDLHPTAISHSYGQGFPVEFDKIGTRDPSAWLTVPDAITFHQELGGAVMRERNRDVALRALRRMVTVLDTEAGAPEALFGSLVTARLPTTGPTTWTAAGDVSKLFYDHHRIVIPVMSHSDALWLRLSVAAYVDVEDIERVLAALPDVLERIS